MNPFLLQQNYFYVVSFLACRANNVMSAYALSPDGQFDWLRDERGLPDINYSISAPQLSQRPHGLGVIHSSCILKTVIIIIIIIIYFLFFFFIFF
jgi:hypothetical protein